MKKAITSSGDDWGRCHDRKHLGDDSGSWYRRNTFYILDRGNGLSKNMKMSGLGCVEWYNLMCKIYTEDTAGGKARNLS